MAQCERMAHRTTHLLPFPTRNTPNTKHPYTLPYAATHCTRLSPYAAACHAQRSLTDVGRLTRLARHSRRFYHYPHYQATTCQRRGAPPPHPGSVKDQRAGTPGAGPSRSWASETGRPIDEPAWLNRRRPVQRLYWDAVAGIHTTACTTSATPPPPHPRHSCL